MSTRGEGGRRRKNEEQEVEDDERSERNVVAEDILFNRMVNSLYQILPINEPARLNINYEADYVIKRIFVVIGRTD